MPEDTRLDNDLLDILMSLPDDDANWAVDFEEPADWWKNDMIVDKQPVEPVVWREEPEEVVKADLDVEIYPLLL